jgi:hypothetical protein
VIVEHDPERLRVHHGQVRDHADQHILLAFFMKRPRQVMVIDHIIHLVGPDHDRDLVPAEQFRALLVVMFAPALPLFPHLPHPDRHLGRAQRHDRHRLKHRFALDDHLDPPSARPSRAMDRNVASSSIL